MPPTVQVGATLTNESLLMMPSFGLETAPCSGNWSLVKVLDGFTLDRKIHAAGWNFFYTPWLQHTPAMSSGAATSIAKRFGKRPSTRNCLS